MTEQRYRFFLGGADLEMATIRELLEQHAPGRIEDNGLAWGAKVSAYRDEIRGSLARGETPVLIELADDLPAAAFDRGRCVVVDHHGGGAGAKPTALEQVFTLLGLDPAHWSRWHALVAANDKGHIRAMRVLGASDHEISRVRHADLRAQGVTAEEEAGARAAIAARTTEGRLTLVRIPHDRTSAAADLIEPVLGGPGADQLLVETPHELAFFGDGRVVETLAREVPSSWCGGDLPERGFWGAALVDPTARARIRARIQALVRA